MIFIYVYVLYTMYYLLYTMYYIPLLATRYVYVVFWGP